MHATEDSTGTGNLKPNGIETSVLWEVAFLTLHVQLDDTSPTAAQGPRHWHDRHVTVLSGASDWRLEVIKMEVSELDPVAVD
jgi:hypothetical protein